ncbi:hypothetical protein, partial [Acinetobacter radioresistens]|uniref:hypothetical protein n=1 Tax=Acinetobacter radioresistens TaxID=40216 RepID=UPI001D0E17A0
KNKYDRTKIKTAVLSFGKFADILISGHELTLSKYPDFHRYIRSDKSGRLPSFGQKEQLNDDTT